MELDICENRQNSLFANLVDKVCKGTSLGKSSFSIQPSELTDEVWKEIIKYNLDPESPCFLYFEDSSADNTEVKVVCKT